MPTETSWQVIQTDQTLTTFRDAVAQYPQVVELLNPQNPQQQQTIFLPTNQALAAMPNWPTIAADQALLTEFIRLHTVNGVYTAEQLFTATGPITNVEGDQLQINVNQQTINNQTIQVADTSTANAVLHTVSGPLFVPEMPPPTTATNTTVAGGG